MDLQLQGECAFVSGSTAGIGFSAALGLAKEGLRLRIEQYDQQEELTHESSVV